jgi:hypothetical protein
LGIDNSEKLSSPTIQRLIKLLAPLCEKDFMIVWKKEVEQSDAPTGSWSKVFSAGRSAVSATFSLFSTPEKPKFDQNTLQDLKIKVETRGLDVDTFSGFKQAMNYFMSSFEYKAFFSTMIQNPRPILNEVVPSAAMELASSTVAKLA